VTCLSEWRLWNIRSPCLTDRYKITELGGSLPPSVEVVRGPLTWVLSVCWPSQRMHNLSAFRSGLAHRLE
jgi:hypothetical protein